MPRLKHLPTDPVLTAADFRCTYCGCDLLGDIDSFLTLCRDHFKPRHAGGRNRDRVASCAACDRIKAGRQFESVEKAQAFIASYRANVELHLDRVRATVRMEGGA